MKKAGKKMKFGLVLCTFLFILINIFFVSAACSECGGGLFNICDEKECIDLGTKTDECVFLDGFLGFNSCITESEYSQKNLAISSGINYPNTIHVNHCMEINQENTNYILDNDLTLNDSSTNVCLNVTASNINLNGNGHFVGGAVFDCQDLQNIANNPSASYFLANDINCSETIRWNCDANGWNCQGFQPIPSFSGTFDGNGHIITDLYINMPADSYNNIGLFKTIESRGEVKNLGIRNIIVIGNHHVASLAGTNLGKISNSYVSVPFSNYIGRGINIKGGAYVGGLIGENNGTIENSYFSGTIGVLSNSAGAIAGKNSGLINNCYAEGSVNPTQDIYISNIGGLVGVLQGGNVTNSLSKVDISFSYSHGSPRGGVVGASLLPGGIIENCYFRTYSQTYSICMETNPEYNNANTTIINCTLVPANYFDNSTNPPMSTWDFENTWQRKFVLSCSNMIQYRKCDGNVLLQTSGLADANTCKQWCQQQEVNGSCCGYDNQTKTCVVTNGFVIMGGGVKAKDYASGCSSYFMQMPPTLKSFNHPISYETGDTSNTGIVINNVENISVINFNEPTIVNILNSKGVSIQDLDRVKKCNIVNSFLIFENENGSINFQEPITSKFMSGEIPSVIKINLKDIEVDANARPELNKPAIISIYNLSVNDTTIREMRGLYNNHFVPIEFANIKSYEPFTIWVNGFDICQPNPWVTGCFNDTGYLICILGPRCHHPSIDSWCPSGLGTHEILVDVISCSEGRACMNNHLCP